MSCPVRSLQIWKDLVDTQGENLAYYLFDKYDGDVPAEYYIKKEESVDKPIQYFQAAPRDGNAKLRSNHLKGFIGLKSKTVSPQQKISALKRLEIYNKKYNTSHHITFDRVGESMNYTWSIDEKWNAFDPTQGLLFELPKTTPSNEKIEELDQKLITMLSAMGVTVEQFNNFKEEYGLDAVGVMEILDGAARIRFDENRTDELTLPEETAHFFIELFGDSQIAQRLIESMKVNDYYKVVLGEEYEAYENQYNGDINKLAKEAAGKLLAQAIVSRFKQEELQIPQASYNLLKRFWNYIKNIFSKVSQTTTNKMISDLYSEVAASILSNEYSHLRLQNIKGRQIYFQISDMALNRLKSALNKTVETTAKRIQILKAKSKTTEAFKDSEYLETLIESLDNDTYVHSALSYAEFARTKFKRVNDAVIALRKKFSDLDQVSILEAATTLRDMSSFARSYSTSINELKLEVDRILLEEPDNADYKKVSAILSELVGAIKVLEGEYLDLARPIFAKYLEPFIGGGFVHVNLEDDLKFMTNDISFAQRWIDSMAEASSPVLQLIDVAVKEAKRTSYEEAYSNSKSLLAALDELKSAGIKDQDWMYERLSNGTLTGNFVTEKNWGQYEHDRREFFDKLLTDLGLPKEQDKRREVLAKDPAKNKAYGKAWGKWLKDHSKTVDNVNDIIQDHRKSMTTEEYAVWDASNITRDPDTGDIMYFKGELTEPSKMYDSKVHSDILSNKAKLNFYNKVIGMKAELDKLLPDNFRSGRLAPQIKKDFVERLKSAAKGDVLEMAKEQLRENFIINEDDVNFGSRIKMTDEANNLVNFLPIYFTKKLTKVNDMSTDVVSTMSSFALMAHEYSQMNKIIDILELGRDVMDAREVLETDSEGNPIMESLDILGKKVLKKVRKSKIESNYTIDRLNDYYNMVVYGKMKVEGKSLDVFGTKLNSTAMLELLGKYTAISNLGLNLYAGIQNPIVGNTNIRLEGIAGQFVTNKDLLNADLLYWKLMPKRMADFGVHNATNKMDLWYEFFDVNQSFGSQFREMDTSRKSLISKLFKTSSLFVMSSAGEHYMQLKMSLALAIHQKLKDKSGKEITLVDAYEVVGNKLQLKEGVTKLDGTTWTNEDTRQFIRRQNFINKRLHGIYNDVDKGAMQQYAAMRLVMMFRKFMRPGYNRRWRKLDYSFEGQAETEGYYRTFGRFAGSLIKDLKRGEFLLKAHWEQMSPTERFNIMRTLGEIGFLLALMGAMIALNSLGDDDDDNWFVNMFAYQVFRYQSELLFFIDPRQTMTLLKSPAAAVDQANKLIDFTFLLFKPGYAMEEISKGKWAGYSRLEKASIGTIPLAKTITDWAHPSDKLVFYRLNN